MEGGKEGEIEIEVQVTCGKTSIKNNIWKQELKDCSNSMRMLITWDMTTALDAKQTKPVTHCLFCKKVSEGKKTF